MPEPQLSSGADAEGIAKLLLVLFGAGGFLKLSLALLTRLLDRWMKRDEVENLHRQSFEAIAWQRLRDEEELNETLRKEYASVREQLYAANTAHALQGLELDRAREECRKLNE